MLSGYARENGIYARHNRMAPISTHPYTFLLHHFSYEVVDNSACAHILIRINSLCDHSPEHTVVSVYNSAFPANCQFREKEIDTWHK